MKVTHVLTLPFIQSVGDHRTWVVELTTRSMLGTSLVKVQRVVARRLVSTKVRATKSYHELVKNTTRSMP